MAISSAKPYAEAIVRDTPRPGVRYVSGLTIHDEELVHGRWIGRYWAANGFVEPERNLVGLVERLDPSLPAFELNVDGQSLQFGWVHVASEVQATAKGVEAVVRLRHQARPVDLALHTLSDGSGLLQRWLEITNTGAAPAALSSVAPWAGELARVRGWDQTPGMDEGVFSVGYFDQAQWAMEGGFRWLDLPRGGFRVQSVLGWSGHGAPFFVLRNNLTGQHFVGALGWSGTWGLDLYQEVLPGEASVWFKFGPQQPAPLRVIAPGETVTSPAVHLGCLDADLDGAVQAYHDHVRRTVLPPPRAGLSQLVAYNHWGYRNDELSEPMLKHQVDEAAEIGAEVFVVDAGWYADKGTNWHQLVGDWDEGNRIDCGLDGIFAYARSKGLKCGLWVDIERLGADSRTAKEHPEWLLPLLDTTTTAINTAITEARQYMADQLAAVIARYELDWFKLDRNVHVWENGYNARDGYLESVTWRHYEFVYDLYRRLRERFPGLMMENCAGGGGRPDLGMMAAFDTCLITDWPRPPRSTRIFNGMSLCLPPERLFMLGGVAQDGHERADLDYQLRQFLFGQFYLSGLWPPDSPPNPAQVARIKHAVSLYKSWVRPWLPECRMYHHTPELPGLEPSGWCVWESVSADRSRALVGLFRLAGPAEEEYALRLRGLDPGREYRVTFDNSGDPATLSGAALMNEGLRVRLARPMTSELLVVEAALL